MGDRSKIEWTDATWNPIRARIRRRDLLVRSPRGVGWHCEHVSEGCRNCYAEAMNRRLGTGLDFKPGHRKDVELYLDEKILLQPLRWRRSRRVFVCSMTDLFAEFVPDEWIERVFAVMSLCEQHRFQLLTKRPERGRAFISSRPRDSVKPEQAVISTEVCDSVLQYSVPWPLPNVVLGTSAENQATADERIPHLLATPAAVRFVSLEPLLGPIDLDPSLWRLMSTDELPGYAINDGCVSGRALRRPGLDWAIVGGESGRGARPMHVDWVCSIRDQCVDAGVPFFFKQWGEWSPNGGGRTMPPHDYLANDGSLKVDDPALNIQPMVRVGKKRAGRLLDGRTWDELPEMAG